MGVETVIGDLRTSFSKAFTNGLHGPEVGSHIFALSVTGHLELVKEVGLKHVPFVGMNCDELLPNFGSTAAFDLEERR